MCWQAKSASPLLNLVKVPGAIQICWFRISPIISITSREKAFIVFVVILTAQKACLSYHSTSADPPGYRGYVRSGWAVVLTFGLASFTSAK